MASPVHAELTEQQERMASNFSTAINNASSLFKEQKFTEAAAELTRAQRILDNLSKKPSDEVLQKIGKDYRRLQKAHELIASKGVKLDPLKELTIPKGTPAPKKATEDGDEDAAAADAEDSEEKSDKRKSTTRKNRTKREEAAAEEESATESGAADEDSGEKPRKRTGRRAGTKAKEPKAAGKERAAEERTSAANVSFSRQVAPLLVQHCGKCHIEAKKGKYSIASYQTMMDTGSVVESDPDGSELLQKITSGEMPPSKGGAVTVPESESSLIRSWIEQGARFDGDDPDTNLQELAASQGESGK